MNNPRGQRRRAVSRRQFLQFAASAAAAAAATFLSPSGAEPAVAEPLPKTAEPQGPAHTVRSAERAAHAYEAQQRHLYRPVLYPGDATSLYLEQTPQGDSRPCSFVWPFSQAAAAALDLLGLPDGVSYRGLHGGLRYQADVQDRLYRGLEQYWNGSGYEPCPVEGGRHASDGIWYDDNAWAGLDLARAYRMTGDGAALARSRQVFEYITAGWCEGQGHAKQGGIFWVKGNDNHHRNTCSNAPVAELGLRLYELTGQQSYLHWAMRIYDWVNGALLADDGLYWDHIDLDGTIDRSVRSYNQGTMAGAGALLYKITGDAGYLGRAKRTARAALERYGLDGLVRQNPAFNAIFFRNLLLLSTVDDELLAGTLRNMQGYADYAWANMRTPDGLYPFPNGATTTRLLHQAGMVQVFACLAWDPATYGLLV